MPVLQSEDKDLPLKVAISASVALGCMFVEFLWLMRDEVNLVWPRLRMSWTARLYIVTRYTGLASQVYNVYFTVRMCQGIYTSPTGCRNWFAYQATMVQFLLITTEGLFMHRLYALFLRNQMILAMLISFALCQIASMGVSAGLAFPSNKHTTTCLMVRSNPGSAFFSATTMTTNIIIFLMTFSRYLRLPAKWVHEGLGRVVFRDSACSLMAITVVMLFLTLCSLEVIKPTMAGNITYYWLICVLWVSIGRVVVNHEKIRKHEDEHGDGSVWRSTTQLTSQIELGQISRDSQTGSVVVLPVPPNSLRSSLSIPVSKGSSKEGHLPTSPCTTDSSRTWFGAPSLSDTDGHPQSPQLSKHSLKASNTRTCSSDSDAPQMEDPSADADQHAPSPDPDPRPSSPMPLPLESVEVS